MTPLEFNYQVGDPNATFPPSLTVKSSDAGVSILSLAPTHKYVAFGLTTTPPAPPAPSGPPLDSSDNNAYFVLETQSFNANTINQFNATVGSNVLSVTSLFGGESNVTYLNNLNSYTNLVYLHLHYCPNITSLDISELVNIGNGGGGLTIHNMNSLQTLVVGTFYYLNYYNLFSNAFTEDTVNNILITADNIGLNNGTMYLDGGSNASPTGAGVAAWTNLLYKGWYVSTN